MTKLYKSDVECFKGMYIPVVHEYNHGEIVKTYEFKNAPTFDNALSAYIYAKKEEEIFNRRLYHEER